MIKATLNHSIDERLQTSDFCDLEPVRQMEESLGRTIDPDIDVLYNSWGEIGWHLVSLWDAS